MPPTRTRAATSAEVRPVRIATATRSGRSAATRARRRRDRRASGTTPRPPGRASPRPASRRSRTRRAGAPAAPPAGRSPGPRRSPRARGRHPGLAVRGQGVTSTPGRIVSSPAAMTSGPMPPSARRDDRSADGRWPRRSADAATGEALGGRTVADGLAVAIAIGGLGVAGGGGSGANTRSPPSSQRRDGDTDHQAGDDRQACFHVARRVPVREGDGASAGTAATMPLPWVPSRIASARESFRRS